MNARPGMVERFRANPASIRRATLLIVTVTILVVVLGAVVIRIFDGQEYPTFGKALWFTLQTITTVGYGDATPTAAIGRIVAGIVMVTAIGVITVVTALITSVFVDSARAEGLRSTHADTADNDALARLETSLARLDERLDRLESTLGTFGPDTDSE